jgi:hypothetical protein
MEGVTAFRQELYRGIDRAVRHWTRERHFMNNVLLSAALFVTSYLLLELGLRTTLPAWVEVGGSAGAAGLLYWYLLRRQEQAPEAEEKREYLRSKIDRIRFREDEFVKEVEERLHRNESIGTEQLLEALAAPQERSFSSRDIEDARQLLGYLERRLAGKGYRRQERILERYRRKGRPRLRKLSRAAHKEKLDLSLFAMYRNLKERFEISEGAGGW